MEPITTQQQLEDVLMDVEIAALKGGVEATDIISAYEVRMLAIEEDGNQDA